MVALISHRVDLRKKKIFRYKKAYCTMIKGSVCQGDIAILSKYAHLNGALECIKKTNRNLTSNRIIHNFSWRHQHFSIHNRTNNRKPVRIQNWKHYHQMDLIDIYRKQCTPSRRILFSSVPEIFIKIGHILGHKTTKKNVK